MKKIKNILTGICVFFILMLINSCTTTYSIKYEFDKSYDYDTLYQATLNALNDESYTIKKLNKKSGWIHAVKTTFPYMGFTIGLLEIIPLPFIQFRYPEKNIVLSKKKKGGIFLDLNEINTNIINDIVLLSFDNDFISQIKIWYNILYGIKNIKNNKKETKDIILPDIP